MFRPLLAPNKDPQGYTPFFQEICFPQLVSPKLDGIRAVNRGEGMISRSLKLLPNLHMQNIFGDKCLFLDGELIDGDDKDSDVFNRTQSSIMSKDKEAFNVTYHVFDCVDNDILNEPFEIRHNLAKIRVQFLQERFPTLKVKIVPHKLVYSLEELLAFESECLEEGYEGIMGRSPKGVYKTNARCTWNEGIIFKLKRFKDEEGVIVGFVERMHNTNEDQTNELGRTFRRDTKDAKQAMGMVGKFLVQTEDYGIIEVGPGQFKHDELKFVWEHREPFISKYLKFRHFPHGMKDKPRFPRAIGFRDEMDM